MWMTSYLEGSKPVSSPVNPDVLVKTQMMSVTVQPSSAAAERAFSFLNSGFNDQQEQSLQDYIEASAMLRYNKNKY